MACPDLFLSDIHIYTPHSAKSADAVLPNAAAGASAPLLRFESSASAGFSNLYLAEAKSADAVLPNAAAGASAPMLRFESPASAGLSNFILLKKACGQKTTGFSYFTSF
ncbi:MAG: hypothetical protein LKG90_08985 [Lachnospiraceae bacterium]|jgi:hypothetical protein|nr:hypothetical protein [Lachnospiraceae bacterium]MCH4029278.1 hypothetical protein [Lachnospiraceae bacterium]MCH4067871.1 hypothetical protein [Lachnospiraceae bacterium]MCH4113895.1 hypothetical protein [Lachnospiraceae bacterium]MCI1353898.1 hypothetical protein [Lachnospiraceae bacterium]